MSEKPTPEMQEEMLSDLRRSFTGEVTQRAEAAEARNAELEARVGELEAALETIAEEHDAGRHDGLPEPCPAHDDVFMWAIARAALSGSPAPVGEASKDLERLEKMAQRLTDAMARWDWSHCTTEVELIEQIDALISQSKPRGEAEAQQAVVEAAMVEYTENAGMLPSILRAACDAYAKLREPEQEAEG